MIFRSPSDKRAITTGRQSTKVLSSIPRSVFRNRNLKFVTGSRPSLCRLSEFLFLALVFAMMRCAMGQGCIASPNNPCSHLIPGEFTNTMSLANRWLGSVDYRWYESFRHFVGDVEQPQREAMGNNVINDVHAFNVAGTYGFSDRWSATINFPFIYADRSSLYEHDFIHRHSMHSGGLGDLRLVTDFWLLSPQTQIGRAP